MFGSTIALIKSPEAYATPRGILVRLFSPVNSLGKDSEAIISIFIYLSCNLSWGKKATLALLSKAEDNTTSATLGGTWSGVVPDSENSLVWTHFFPRLTRSCILAHLPATASHCFAPGLEIMAPSFTFLVQAEKVSLYQTAEVTVVSFKCTKVRSCPCLL